MQKKKKEEEAKKQKGTQRRRKGTQSRNQKNQHKKPNKLRVQPVQLVAKSNSFLDFENWKGPRIAIRWKLSILNQSISSSAGFLLENCQI